MITRVKIIEKHAPAKGFTLIEILVAISIFAIVMTLSLGAFLNISDIQKKTESFRVVNDSLNFIMEAMVREIKEGYNYKCENGTCNSFSFTMGTAGVAEEITYARIEDSGNGRGNITRKQGELADEQRITPNSLDIQDLTFTTRGDDPGPADTTQPLVTINLSAESGKKDKLKSQLNLQTTVSQRRLDTGYIF